MGARRAATLDVRSEMRESPHRDTEAQRHGFLSYLLQAVSLCLCVSVLNGVLHAQSPKGTQTTERVVHVAPFGAGGARYVYVPFDVPRGAVRITVAYDYAREGGANTLDLGVFDARSDGPGAEV